MSALTKALDGALKEQDKTASIQTLTGLELTTIAGQTAFVQIGHRKPRIVGTSFSQRGLTNNLSMEDVGSIVQITPQVVPDGSLVVAVDIERSDLGPEAEGKVIATMEDGTEIRSPQTDTMMAKTTISTANGQAVVVNDLICDQQRLRKETFVLLRPLVVGATDSR
jgi:type II secretory pathway component GspD/PulD (secretin)